MAPSVSSLLISLLVASANAQRTRASEAHHLRHTDHEQVEEDRALLVDGVATSNNEFPWFASMLRSDPDGPPGCGGTLIAPNRVLTAAHCMVENMWVKELGLPAYVRIGHTNHDNGEVLPVECVSIHPNYISRYNDLAIVKLAENATTTSFAKLNNDTAYPSKLGQQLTAVGFGSPSGLIAIFGTVLLMRIPKSKRLQKMSTTFLPEQTCRQSYRCANAQYHACAQATDAGVCYGDSGGPLVDENNLQVGVIAFKTGDGFGCAEDSPDVFMNVARYMDWIQQEIASDVCSSLQETAFKSPCRTSNSGG